MSVKRDESKLINEYHSPRAVAVATTRRPHTCARASRHLQSKTYLISLTTRCVVQCSGKVFSLRITDVTNKLYKTLYLSKLGFYGQWMTIKILYQQNYGCLKTVGRKCSRAKESLVEWNEMRLYYVKQSKVSDAINF